MVLGNFFTTLQTANSKLGRRKTLQAIPNANKKLSVATCFGLFEAGKRKYKLMYQTS
jgi:hypothetical protein